MVTITEMDARVQAAMRSAWSRLTADEIATVGQNLERLAEALHERYGFDETLARYEASATLATAMVPAQPEMPDWVEVLRANVGWVEILRSPDGEAIGRGQMLIHGTAPDTAGRDLRCTIQHLHMREGHSMTSGSYLVRFEANGEVRPVAVIATPEALAARTIGVAFMDDGLPIALRELSAGE